MKTVLSLLVLTFMINLSSQVTSVYFYLEPQERECLFEYFSDKTLVIFEAHFNVTEANVQVTDPEDKTIADKQRVNEFKEAFTTFSGGYYGLCLTNKDREHIAEVRVNLRHGVAAKDYSAVAKAKDLKPMELDVNLK